MHRLPVSLIRATADVRPYMTKRLQSSDADGMPELALELQASAVFCAMDNACVCLLLFDSVSLNVIVQRMHLRCSVEVKPSQVHVSESIFAVTV